MTNDTRELTKADLGTHILTLEEVVRKLENRVGHGAFAVVVQQSGIADAFKAVASALRVINAYL